MTIYTQFGTPVWIIALHEHSIPLSVTIETKQTFTRSGIDVINEASNSPTTRVTRLYPISMLRADNGIREIFEAMLHINPNTQDVSDALKRQYGYHFHNGKWSLVPKSVHLVGLDMTNDDSVIRVYNTSTDEWLKVQEYYQDNEYFCLVFKSREDMDDDINACGSALVHQKFMQSHLAPQEFNNYLMSFKKGNKT